MPRRLDTLFEDEIAAEKARLEAQVAGLENGPKKYQLRKRIRQLETASHLKDGVRRRGFARAASSGAKNQIIGPR